MVLNFFKTKILKENLQSVNVNTSCVNVNVEGTIPHPVLAVSEVKGYKIYVQGSTSPNVENLNHLKFKYLGELNGIFYYNRFSLKTIEDFKNSIKIKNSENFKKDITIHQFKSIQNVLENPEQHISIHIYVGDLDSSSFAVQMNHFKQKFPGCVISSNYFDDVPVMAKNIYLNGPLYNIIKSLLYVNYSQINKPIYNTVFNNKFSPELDNISIREAYAVVKFKKTEEGVISTVVLPPKDTFKVKGLIEIHRKELPRDGYQIMQKSCDDDLNYSL